MKLKPALLASLALASACPGGGRRTVGTAWSTPTRPHLAVSESPFDLEVPPEALDSSPAKPKAKPVRERPKTWFGRIERVAESARPALLKRLLKDPNLGATLDATSMTWLGAGSDTERNSLDHAKKLDHLSVTLHEQAEASLEVTPQELEVLELLDGEILRIDPKRAPKLAARAKARKDLPVFLELKEEPVHESPELTPEELEELRNRERDECWGCGRG